jgi:hypothetical protein
MATFFKIVYNYFVLFVKALDPAGPWFSMSSNNNRVQKSDANLVDVIHTNSGSIVDVNFKTK